MGPWAPWGPMGPYGALRGPTPWSPIGPWAHVAPWEWEPRDALTFAGKLLAHSAEQHDKAAQQGARPRDVDDSFGTSLGEALQCSTARELRAAHCSAAWAPSHTLQSSTENACLQRSPPAHCPAHTETASGPWGARAWRADPPCTATPLAANGLLCSATCAHTPDKAARQARPRAR